MLDRLERLFHELPKPDDKNKISWPMVGTIEELKRLLVLTVSFLDGSEGKRRTDMIQELAA